MEDTHVHALDYLSVVRRRKWSIILPIVASIVVGLALVKLLPKAYRSSTTLGVAAPVVSPNLVGQSAPFDNQERLRALSQQLLSPPILSRVAREEGLASSPAPTDADVAKLRRAIEVQVPDPVIPVEGRRLDTFVVSYSDPDPARAQRITARLATVFVDENSRSRTQQAEGTASFIATQLRASQERLAGLEERLRTAKEAHMGRLPEQLQANLQTLSGLRQQLEANSTALRSEQDRLSMIDRQVEGLRQGSPNAILVGRADESTTTESRVLALQRELAEARATFTEKHPEIQRIQQELDAAKRDLATERQRPPADRLAQLQMDPAYQQLTAEQETSRLRIRELQINASDAQRQIAMYQTRVEAAPTVEQQLGSLQRDYDLERQQYADLSNKLHAATISENVERNRSGEQFTILFPANYPTEPTQPIPMRVMLVSILAGLCAGAALTLGREYFDRSVHDVRELKDAFDVPVLGEVARIQTA